MGLIIDPLVETWNDENSANLANISSFDFVVISILHDVTNRDLITNSKVDVYDLTGKTKGVNSF